MKKTKGRIPDVNDLEHTPMWARTNPHLITSQSHSTSLTLPLAHHLLRLVREEIRMRRKGLRGRMVKEYGEARIKELEKNGVIKLQ